MPSTQNIKYKWLLKPVKDLKGVGDKLDEALDRLGIRTIHDLLLYLPVESSKKIFLEDYRIDPATTYIVKVKINFIQDAKSGSKFIILGTWKNIGIELIFFNFVPYHIINKISVGGEYYFIGKLKRYKDRLQVAHPEMYQLNQKDAIRVIDPKYHLTYGINSKIIHDLIIRASSLAEDMDEWLPSKLVKHFNLPSFMDAIYILHFITSDNQYNKHYQNALLRVTIDELFAHQIMLRLTKYHRDKVNKPEFHIDTNIINQVLHKLPFALTEHQKKALSDIKKDLLSSHKMMRLLQGDVGSGKTIVAIISSLMVISGGYQAAIMAPTDILATQHYIYAKELLSEFGINVVLLKSKMKASEKRASLEMIESGDAHLVIGTHSLIQEDVKFYNLRLAVIDEQHRFGVEQRLALANKGHIVDVLLMTATPIPRSLMMAKYGDISVSIIAAKPEGRQAIDTMIIPMDRLKDVIIFINKLIELNKNSKIYWVCSLIDENDEDAVPKEEIMDKKLTTLVDRFDYLKKIFGNNVLMLHGKMPNDQKNLVMDNFKNTPDNMILVATTVIEVGVNVPEANLIIIENPEQFGISQLHQLRGRVGRGSDKSYCILFRGKSISKSASEKIVAIKNSNDGFYLSEVDLKIRGAGDHLGIRQSGDVEFKVAYKYSDLDYAMDVAIKETSAIFNEVHEELFLSEEYIAHNNKIANIAGLLSIFNYEKCLKYGKT